MWRLAFVVGAFVFFSRSATAANLSKAFVTGNAGGNVGLDLTGSLVIPGIVTIRAEGTAAQKSGLRTISTLADKRHAGIDQIPAALEMTKTCPVTELPGASFQCTFTIENFNSPDAVLNLVVTNTVPFPGGTPVAVPCEFPLGIPVTTLQPSGTPGDTCSGTVDEIAPACSATGATFLTDLVAASGTYASGNPASGSVTNSVQVLACVPSPTNTPMSTPVPTLAHRGMLAFGVLLALVAALVLRR
jgi:hypothetical protein